MKFLIAFALTISASAFASDFSYTCKQRADRSPIDSSLGKIHVQITHVKNIGSATEYRGEYRDSIDVVRVVMTASKSGKTKVLKNITTVSTSEDVMFMIQEKEMTFHLYLDEVEEASVKTMVDEKEINVSLTCE